VVLPAHAFSCERCGKPLRAGRVRQGVRVHKECRAQARDGERRAAGSTTASPDPTRAQDPELRELFARAAAQARELVDDLQRLQALGGDAKAKPGGAQR